MRKQDEKAAPGTPQAPPGWERAAWAAPCGAMGKSHFLTKSDPFTEVKPHSAKTHVFAASEPVTKVTCEVADASVSNRYLHGEGVQYR